MQLLWKTVWQFLTMLSIGYYPAIPLLGIHPRELKTYVHIKTCTQMFIAVLSTIVKRWKQPKHPSADEWVNKMCYILTMGYYSAIKRNEMEVFVVRWMDLESVIQSEVSPKVRGQVNEECP